MNLETKYQNALEYLSSFVDYSLKDQKIMAAADFNLDRVFDLMVSLGNPQENYPSIHVAGSKGKGSVSALCASALQAQGYKVGLYTSPHLHHFEERIQINREMISRTDLVRMVDEIKPHVAAIPNLTAFEIETALALWFFSIQQVDVAVIEVGLGGRLDATNVITPRVSVITALFLEHTLFLGDTLSKIAAEKAGIIKPGIPVVLSPQSDDALQVIAHFAARNNSPLVLVGRDYTFESINMSLENQSFMIRSEKTGNRVELQINLLGLHQVENATTAYATLQVLRDQGVAITDEAIRRGFSLAKWPARFEILCRKPTIIVDAAHTPDAVRKLSQTIDQILPNRPLVLVFGASDDKNVQGMFAELLPKTQHLICAKSSHPRSIDVNKLKDLALPFGIATNAIENIGQAIIYAKQVAGDEAIVLITGSIFLAGDARFAIKEQL
jgi:dihydrofolate synthase/folylpolyglutamate synthase